MRKMTIVEFHDVLATYISKQVKTLDLSDPDTIVFTEEFDNLIRILQSRGGIKPKTVYLRENQYIRTLYRQFDNVLQSKDEVRLL